MDMDKMENEIIEKILKYCPRCGNKLVYETEETEAWVKCPIHGDIFLEYWEENR